MSKRLHAWLGLIAAVGIAASAASATIDEGRQRAERFLDGLETLRAEFTQTLSDRTGQVTDESSGTLAIQRPNRFRWDYRDPYEQLIVCDGERIWVYDSDLEQVTVRKLDMALSSTPAMLLSGQGALTDNFEVTEVSERTGVFWVHMQPKRDDTDFKVVRLGFSSNKAQELRAMELVDKLGQTTLLTFSKIERNPSLDSSQFVFEVPPGADVIGDTGQVAPRADAR
ncbi:MAG TPA: outer membrane lipoprotein chaperone LolA [Steroidobacteraceae bacterium]